MCFELVTMCCSLGYLHQSLAESSQPPYHGSTNNFKIYFINVEMEEQTLVNKSDCNRTGI